MKIRKYVLLTLLILIYIMPSFLIFNIFSSYKVLNDIDKIGSKAIIWTDVSGDVIDAFTMLPATHDPVDITTIDENASLDMLNVSFVGTPASGSNPGWTYWYYVMFDKDHDNLTQEYMLFFDMDVGGSPSVYIQRNSDSYYWNGTDWDQFAYYDNNWGYVSGSNNMVFNFSTCPDLIGDNWYNIAAAFSDMATVYYFDLGGGDPSTPFFFAGGSTGVDIWAPLIQDTRCVPSVALSGGNFTFKANVTDDTNVSLVYANVHNTTNVIQNVTLFDDGAHDDGAANDSIFANTWNSTGQVNGTYYIDFWVNDTLNNSRQDQNAREFIIGTVPETGLFDGMYVNWSGLYYWFSPLTPINGTENYHLIEGNMYLNDHNTSDPDDDWITDNATRYLVTGGTFWGDKVHDHMFIPLNRSISDTVLITKMGTDINFTIVGIKYLNILNMTLECWELTETTGGNSLLYYETSTGVLVNGTFDLSLGYFYTFTADASNAPFDDKPGFSIESPKNKTYYHSDVSVIIANKSAVEYAWYRNSTDGIVWSNNQTLSYNGTHYINSSHIWAEGTNVIQIYANNTDGDVIQKEEWFTIDTYGPWIELDLPENATYLYRSIPIVVSNYTNVDYIAFSYNNGSGWTTNTTLPWNGTHYANDSISWLDGNYHLRVYANDSTSETAMREVWFIIIASLPLNISHNSEWNLYPDIVCSSPGNVHIVWITNVTSEMEIYYDDNSNGHFGNMRDISNYPLGTDGPHDAAVDSAGNVHLVWNQDQGIFNMKIVYSNNTGGTFNPPVEIPTPLVTQDIFPVVAVDSQNIAHIAWVGGTLANTIIYYTNNSGGSFNVPINVSSSSYNVSYPFAMDVDGADVIHLAYASYINGDFEIIYQNITNGNPSTPVNVSNRIGSDIGPSISVNSTGTVHIAWRANSPTTSSSDIFYSNGTSGVFSPPLNISLNGSVRDISPCIELDETPDKDIIFISWVHNSSVVAPWSQMQLVMINNSLGSFGIPKKITPYTTFINITRLAIDPINQQVHIVWMAEHVFTGSNDPVNIYYTYLNYSYPTGIVLNLLLPQNQTYNQPEIPIVVSNSSLVDTMWVRNNSGSGWSQNETLYFNGTHFENQTALIWLDGHYNVQVFANDSFGMEYMIEEFFTLDTQRPLITITDPMNGTFVSDSTVWINGTVDSTGSSISSVMLNSSDFSLFEDPTGAPAGSFGFRNQTNLLGNYTLNTTVIDEAGWVNSSIVRFAVDYIQPELVLVEPAGDVVIGTLWFNGTANGTGSQLTLYVNDSRLAAVQNPNGTQFGSFALVNNTSIPDGLLILNLTLVDQVGLTTELIKSVYLDNEIPTIDINTPINGSVLAAPDVSINGSCNSTGSYITSILLNDTRFQLDIDPIGLTEGPYSFINNTDIKGYIALKVNVTDGAGYSKEKIFWFYVDYEDPTINVTNPAVDGTIISAIDIIINGTVNGTGSPIQNVEINLTEFSLDLDPTGSIFGNFSFLNNTNIIDGKYVVEINVTDSANRSILFTRMFYVDRTPPIINATNPSTNGTTLSGLTIWINGTVNATGSIITSFILNNTVDFNIQTNPMGLQEGDFAIWNVTRVNGRIALNITAIDAAGYVSEEIIWLYVDDENPQLSITNPPTDGTAINDLNVTINGTANGTWSIIQSVEINMTEFSLDIDPAGLISGSFSFINNTVVADGIYVVEINVTDNVNRSTNLYRFFYVDRTRPSAPTGLNHTISGSSIFLVWNPVPDLTNVSYLVYRNGVNIANTTFVNYTDSGLSPGIYNYTILAIDDAGNVGLAAEIAVTLPGGIDPRFLFIIILIVLVIAATVSIGSYLLIRSRRKSRPTKKRKEITPKGTIAKDITTQIPLKLKDFEVQLNLKDVGFRVIRNPEVYENSFDLETREIIVREIDMFLIAQQRILAELSPDPTIKTTKIEVLNALINYCNIIIPDFSGQVDPTSLELFFNFFQEYCVNSWILQRINFNLSAYEATTIDKIASYFKALNEDPTILSSKALNFINTLLLAELLAVYTETCGVSSEINNVLSTNPVLQQLHKEFSEIFDQNRGFLPNTASYKAFLENLKALISTHWK